MVLCVLVLEAEVFICGGCCVSQVVEIISLTEHLLGECENRARFSHIVGIIKYLVYTVTLYSEG